MRAAAIAATRPSRSCVSASPTTSIPWARASRVVSGPIETAGQLARAARAGDDDPVVAGGVDGLRADRLDLDQRAEHGRVPERLDPLRELPGLLGRPRDDDAQAPGSGSHP